MLRGDDETSVELLTPNAAGLDNALRNVALIDGLSALLGGATEFSGGNIILGGEGSDTIEGRGGDDFIDGDAYLHVGLTARVAGGDIIREIRTPAAGTDIDTAVFSDAIANYDITNNGDGTHTVAHARGTQTDGTDTLRHIERLNFTDQLLTIGGPNTPATGTVTISDATPDEDQLLSATQAFSDVNGINVGTVLLTWQARRHPASGPTSAAAPRSSPAISRSARALGCGRPSTTCWATPRACSRRRPPRSPLSQMPIARPPARRRSATRRRPRVRH